jgi:hypothetical protein
LDSSTWSKACYSRVLLARNRSASVARFLVDPPKAESSRDTFRVIRCASLAPRKTATNTYRHAFRDDPVCFV